MSTKIYTAWRCSARDFGATFLPAFREHVFEAVAARARASGAKRSNIVEFLARAAVLSAAGTRDDPANDIDCRLAVWIDRGKAYVVPFGEWWVYDGFVPRRAEDFSYWNNTDKPDDVSAVAWRARGKTWDRVCLDDWDAGRMTHVVICAEEELGFVPLLQKLLPGENLHGVLNDIGRRVRTLTEDRA